MSINPGLISNNGTYQIGKDDIYSLEHLCFEIECLFEHENQL